MKKFSMLAFSAVLAGVAIAPGAFAVLYTVIDPQTRNTQDVYAESYETGRQFIIKVAKAFDIPSVGLEIIAAGKVLRPEQTMGSVDSSHRLHLRYSQIPKAPITFGEAVSVKDLASLPTYHAQDVVIVDYHGQLVYGKIVGVERMGAGNPEMYTVDLGRIGQKTYFQYDIRGSVRE